MDKNVLQPEAVGHWFSLDRFRDHKARIPAILLSLGSIGTVDLIVANTLKSNEQDINCVEQYCGRTALDPVRPSPIDLSSANHLQPQVTHRAEKIPSSRSHSQPTIPRPHKTDSPKASLKPASPKPLHPRIVVQQLRRSGSVTPTDLTGLEGYDFSWPQCDDPKPLPDPEETDIDFVSFGLNRASRADNLNECLGEQLEWAKFLRPLRTMFYAFPENHGPSSPEWPKQGTTPFGNCTGGNTRACAWELGKRRATYDLKKGLYVAAAEAGFTILKGQVIWLDVEYNGNARDNFQGGSPDPGNKPTKRDQINNVAFLEGMQQTYEKAGFATGIYTFANHWNPITGGTLDKKSSLYGLPEWRPKHSNTTDAQACKYIPLAGGKVVQVQSQVTINGIVYDRDYGCP